MTAPDVRTAAQTEADKLYPLIEDPRINRARRLRQKAFIKGAAFGAAYVTPTREQIAEALTAGYDSVYSSRMPVNEHDLRAADAVLALIEEKSECDKART